MKNVLVVAIVSAGLLWAKAGNANCWDDDYMTLERFQSCHQTGVDVDLPVAGHRSVLLKVAHGLKYGQSSPGVLEFLVGDAGANVNLRNDDGETALHLVRRHDHVKLLIAAGADVNATTDDGWPVVMTGHKPLDAVRAIVRAGFDVNIDVGGGRNTLLGEFVLHYGLPFVDVLIDGGANVDLPSDGNPVLCLIEYREDRRGEHADIARSLIRAGAETDPVCPRAKQSRGDSPLMGAAADGRIDVVQVLLAAGADVHRLDNGALRYACRRYYTAGISQEEKDTYADIVRLLIAAGARRDYCVLE